MTSHKQGFIALFFTLGVSSILMAYVALSSENIFNYVHTKENFMKSRASIENDFECADQYTNIIIQTYALPSSFALCTVTNANLIQQSSDILVFSFRINNRTFKGAITNGLITELSTLNISL